MVDNGPYGKLIENIIQNRKETQKMSKSMIASSSDCGISFCSLLAIVFITLKLAQIGPVAAWSWWWVLSPLWIPFALLFVGVLIILLVVVFGQR